MHHQKRNNLWLGQSELILAMLFAVACVLLFLAFPLSGASQDRTIQGLTTLIVFLFIAPISYVKFILKKPLTTLGFSWKNKQAGFFWGGLMLIVSLGIAIAIAKTPLARIFALPAGIASSFGLFLLYEVVLANLVLFVLEFFFHGFIFSALQTTFKGWAILIAGVLFIGFLAVTGNLRWAVIALLGGVVAYKSRSFVFAYIMSFAFMIFFDTYLIFISK